MKQHEIEALFQATEYVTGITKKMITSKIRAAKIMEAKSIIMYLLRGKLTTQQIANVVGLERHSTVVSKFKYIDGWFETDPSIQFMVNAIQLKHKEILVGYKPIEIQNIEEEISLLINHIEVSIEKLRELKIKIHEQAGTIKEV